MNETNDTKARMLQEMITTFIPATKKEMLNHDVILLTTEELIAQMAPMIQVDKNELSRTLFDAGFRFVYGAETWRWMLRRKEYCVFLE